MRRLQKRKEEEPHSDRSPDGSVHILTMLRLSDPTTNYILTNCDFYQIISALLFSLRASFLLVNHYSFSIHYIGATLLEMAHLAARKVVGFALDQTVGAA